MSDEIEEIRKAEERRGRRPIDIETVAEKRRILAALREILAYGTVEELKQAMREYGISESSPEWAEALQIWNAERGQR